MTTSTNRATIMLGDIDLTTDERTNISHYNGVTEIAVPVDLGVFEVVSIQVPTADLLDQPA